MTLEELAARIDQRFADLDQRFAAIDGRFAVLETKVEDGFNASKTRDEELRGLSTKLLSDFVAAP